MRDAERDERFSGWARDAEDLVQDVLAKVYLKWTRIDQPDAYARRALTNAVTSRPFTGIVDRLDLLVALRSLPPGQRAVVVLRHLDDRTEEESADLLDVNDLRTDLVRAAGDVSDTGDLVNSATVLGRQRLRRRRRVARTAVTAGLTVIVAGAVWTGTHRSADELRVVPAISTSISPQREAATRALTEAVEDAFPQWSSTDRVLAGLNLGQNSVQNSVQNGWFTVTRGDTDPVELRLTVQRAESSSFPDCSYCTVTTRDDGSDGRLPEDVAFPEGSPVNEETLAALVQTPALQRVDLAG